MRTELLSRLNTSRATENYSLRRNTNKQVFTLSLSVMISVFLSVSCFASPSLSNLFITSGRVLTWMDDCSEQEGQGVTRTKRLALSLFNSSREVVEFIFKVL